MKLITSPAVERQPVMSDTETMWMVNEMQHNSARDAERVASSVKKFVFPHLMPCEALEVTGQMWLNGARSKFKWKVSVR